jgi:hypothetical protein
MVHELELKPGWLSADMEKAAERVREWNNEKVISTHEEFRLRTSDASSKSITKTE